MILTTLLAAHPALAQDIFGAGRSPEQIFASDCSACHKTPQGLAKRSGLFGLQSFLREHYTISSQTASVLAKFLEGQAEPPAAAPGRANQNRRPPAKPATAKPADGKASDQKPSDVKPADAKAEAKPDAKPEPKPDAKPEAKPEAPKLPE